jgi:Di-haem oxidoreductase, putative peroxidase
MNKTLRRAFICLAGLSSVIAIAASGQSPSSQVGREVAIPIHLQDGEEFTTPLHKLIQFGAQLFNAKFTIQEGAGRPFSKGTGALISDQSSPLRFPRNFDRLSSPDANSCAGCHNAPVPGAGGDRVTEVFVLAQRFDHLIFDPTDPIPTRGGRDELGIPVTLDTATNDRKTIGMNGSGFVEMLARQMTADLQAERDTGPIGSCKRPKGGIQLMSKGISFGCLTHNADGTWDTSQVVGLAAPSLSSDGTMPSLIIRPLHQVGNVISIRQFSNNAFNHHHGMQSEERFGLGLDPDGDHFTNELTTADLTAVSLYQATLAVPGRVIPNDPEVEQANLMGEALFDQIGCNSCHIDALPLTADNNPGLPGKPGWIYFEPNPYNPAKGPNSPNLLLGGVHYPDHAPALTVDLTSDSLPLPRLRAHRGVVMVPAYTDLQLHDISATSDPKTDPECEPLDQNQPAGSLGFFAGNCKFITRKLWGFYNQGGAFMHHGKFTTAREAVEAHHGEAEDSGRKFVQLSPEKQGEVIEFLKSLQVLPPGSKSLVVDEHGNAKDWPPSTGSSEHER